MRLLLIGAPGAGKGTQAEYYADREWMFTVDGAQSAEAVHADIAVGLQNLADFTA